MKQRYSWSFVTLILCCLGAAFGLAAQEAALPTGAAIFDRYVEATGGVKAHEKIQNRVTEGTFAVPAQGISIDMTIYEARPNLSYILMESDMIGKMEKGVKDDMVWDLNTMTGASIKEGAERDNALWEANFDKMVNWQKYYEKVECQGKEDFKGTVSYKVVALPTVGNPQTLFFDKESGLIIGIESVVETQGGEVPVTVQLLDYKEFDGLKMPTKLNTEALGQARVISMTSIKQNVELPADRFDPPAEVKALLEQPKVEPKEEPKEEPAEAAAPETEKEAAGAE